LYTQAEVVAELEAAVPVTTLENLKVELVAEALKHFNHLTVVMLLQD
jgi:hypothetical protein